MAATELLFEKSEFENLEYLDFYLDNPQCHKNHGGG